jgi:F-type H+-transporting ATPase subunit epsilon
MAEKLQFELVSPERLLLSEPVGMVVVPGTEGNFGVLPGHALFISAVRPGLIDVYAEGMPTITQRIFVSGGFAEVTPERCTVLADEALPFSALDRAAIEAELRETQSEAGALRDQLARLQGEERDRAALDLAHSERRLAVAQAKLDALGQGTAAH